MKKKNPLEDYKGKDKIPGPKIRLNRQRLEPGGKGYAELVFYGDIHQGHPSCDMERAIKMRDYCVQKNVYVLGMGDYMESGLRSSIGDSVYAQNLNPQKQMEKTIELLEPLANKGLLLGILRGNHENRIMKETGIDITKIMAKQLNVPYLGGACWNLFYVGKQSYSIYSLHGSTGSRFIYTKLKAAVDISHTFEADIIAMGHVHDIAVTPILGQYVDRNRKMVCENKKYIIITGHYLKYDKSYAQDKGMPVSKMGSPKVKLFAEKKDIHESS